MAQRRGCEQYCRPTAVLARLEPATHHSEVEQGEAERHGKRELAREGRRDVAAENRKRAIEQIHGRGDGQQRRDREGQPSEPTEGVGRNGQREHAADGDELEGHAVRDDVAQQRDQQRRQHHVELVRREAGIPIGSPAGQPSLRQQVVAQVRRSPHVRTHVATSGGGVRQDVARSELHEREHHARHDDAQRDVALDRHVGEPLGRRSQPTTDEATAIARIRATGAGLVLGRGRVIEGITEVDLGARTIIGQRVGHVSLSWHPGLAPNGHGNPHRPRPALAHRFHTSTTAAVTLKPTWAQIAGPSRFVRCTNQPTATPKSTRAGNCSGWRCVAPK